MNEKPLFVPLKSEYFESFQSGAKDHELRRYGSRWNEKTCKIGRPVTLSKGYGKENRISGIVVSFERIPATKLNISDRLAMNKIYGTLLFDSAKIGIKINEDKKSTNVPESSVSENTFGRSLLRKDRDWKDYPTGTKAHSCSGGAWIKLFNGNWQWNGSGGIFPTPGADAFGACIELPGEES